MNSPARGLLPAVIAAGVLVLVLFETSNALRESGPWPARSGGRHTPQADPYAPLDALIANGSRDVLPSTIRDPFGYVIVRVGPMALRRPVLRPKILPALEPSPVLTAVVMGGTDPQAVIFYKGHNYTVQVGSVFEEYKVVSISADRVEIENTTTGQHTILRLLTK